MASAADAAADALLDEDALCGASSDDAEAAYEGEPLPLPLLLPLLEDESELAGELSILESASSGVGCPPAAMAKLLAGRLKSGPDMLSPLGRGVWPDATAASTPPASPSALLYRR